MKKKRIKWLLTLNGKARKLLMIMKLTVVLLFAFILGLNANTLSQQKVNLQMGKTTYEELFREIYKQTGHYVIYNNKRLDKDESIVVNFIDEILDNVFKKVLKGKELGYVIKDEFIILKPLPEVKNKEQKHKTIKGKVVDEKGNPLPGATIVVKGTNFGVATNSKGIFEIDVPSIKDLTLVFSFIGLKTKEIKIKNLKFLNIELIENKKSLDEVVITGYQKIKKTDMAGSSSTITKESLIITNTASVEQMLQGKLPGMVITNQSGLVGSRAKVRVRGNSTLLGNQAPVWVVDGIIQEDPIPFSVKEFNTLGGIDEGSSSTIKNFVGNSIAWLNPHDIESITVLKDASATAIYGVKAANGVIVIQTKRGKKGKISINYNTGFSTTTRLTYDKMNLMNSKERIDLSREIYEQGLLYKRPLESVGYEGVLKKYLNKDITYEEFNSEIKRLETVNTDWFDILFRTPLSMNHNISISGGSDRADYYASFGMNENKGTAIGNSSKSYTGSININYRISEKLFVGMKLAGSLNKTKAFNGADPYGYASTTSRAIPCFDENGDYLYYKKGDKGFNFNILNELENTSNENKTHSFNMNINLRYNILKNISFQSTFGMNTSTNVGQAYATEFTNKITNIRGYEFGAYVPSDLDYRMSRLPHGGELNYTETSNFNYTWRNDISFNKTFAEIHRVGFMIGQEIRSNQYTGYDQFTYGYFPGRGKTVSLPPLTIVNSIEESSTNGLYDQMTNTITDRESNYFSLYSTLNYTYDNRYVFNFSIRTDASNKFGQNKKYRFQPVWSVAAKWNIGNEIFMKNTSFIDDLNIRASYGFQGNVAENFSPELIAKIPSRPVDYSTGEYLLNIRSLPYADLRWEKNKSINTGLDFSLFKGRLSGGFQYYYKKTTDAIIYKTVPYEYGVENMPINGGTLTNQGWELSFNVVPIRTKDFTWSIGLNTSKNKNNVESEINPNQNWRSAVSGQLNKKGYPVSAIWVFKYGGVDSKDGTPIFEFPEDIDLNAAALDATKYMVYGGKLDPDFTAGLSTNFKYKAFTVMTSFNLSVGGKRFLAKLFNDDMIFGAPSAYNNLNKDLVDRWRKPGDEKYTDVPGLPSADKDLFIYLPGPNNISDYKYRLYNYTDKKLVDASFLRCNNVAVSYSFPKKITDKLKIGYLSLQANVSNPFIIVSDDYKGKDPEVATGSQPISRSYSFSLNVNF